MKHPGNKKYFYFLFSLSKLSQYLIIYKAKMKSSTKKFIGKTKFQEKIKEIFKRKNVSSKKTNSTKSSVDKQRQLMEEWSEWYPDSPLD